MLRQGEVCVCDLVQVLGVPQPTASRHLGYLRRSGLVNARKDGRWIYYSLSPARNAFHEKLINCLGACFVDVPQLTQDVARLRQCKSASHCCER